MRSTRARLATAGAVLLALALPAAGAPLSSSDWLSGGAAPLPPPSAWRPGDPVPRDALRRPQRNPNAGPPVTASAAVEPVGVTRLAGPDADRVGLQSPERAGLPADLWTGVEAREAAAAIAAADPRLPATGRLLRRILLAQLDPPARAEGEEGVLFLARIDRLLALGEVGAAMALLDAAGPGDAARFRRRFDAALLLDRADSACAELAALPAADADMAARIFCLARGGDWTAASLSLRGADGMGLIDPGLARRLGAFLDDAQVDAADAVPVPEAVTPLDLRLLEAIGQPLPTTGLPLPFAVTDLGRDGGWKARLEAAERLARAGSLSPQRLRAIYLEQPPAASGGVWDRAAGVQRLDAAVAAGDRDGAAVALPEVVAAMSQAGLIPAFGAMLGAPLSAMNLEGQPGTLALWLALIGADAAGAASLADLPAPAAPEDAWLLALARGEAADPPAAPADAFEGAIAAALTGAPAAAQGAPGLLMLKAMADADAGLDGDAARAAAGIASLRALGQQDAARAAALQLILLPRLAAPRG